MDLPPRCCRRSANRRVASETTQSLLVSLADKTHDAEAIVFDYRALGDRNGSTAARRAYAGITKLWLMYSRDEQT